MRINKPIVLATAFALASIAPGKATEIFNETFTYTAGNLTAVSSGAWTNYSGTGTFIQVAGGVLSGLSAGSTSREDVARGLGATYSTGVLYAGFDLNFSGTPVSSAYFMTFKDSGTANLRGRVFIGAPTTAGFRIGVENDAGDGNASVVFSSDLTLNTTYRVILGYDTAAGTSKLWIGPTFNFSSPTIQDTVAATVFGITSIGIRQGGGTSQSYAGLNLDNLIVSTDFSSAIPTAVPEPSSVALAAAGGFAFFLAFRRRR